MMRLYLDTQVGGQQLRMKGWVYPVAPEVSAPIERGEAQAAGSCLGLYLPDIQFFGQNGRRIQPGAGVLEGTRMLLVSGLECTLQPLPEG